MPTRYAAPTTLVPTRAYPDNMPALDPDTQIRVSLIGSTERLAYERGDRDQAIAELARIANGRTDLLAQAAGHFLGGDGWNRDVCYRLLVDAGADASLIEAAAEVTRWNLLHVGHTTDGTAAPG